MHTVRMIHSVNASPRGFDAAREYRKGRIYEVSDHLYDFLVGNGLGEKVPKRRKNLGAAPENKATDGKKGRRGRRRKE